jgi:hypothetical protein
VCVRGYEPQQQPHTNIINKLLLPLLRQTNLCSHTHSHHHNKEGHRAPSSAVVQAPRKPLATEACVKQPSAVLCRACGQKAAEQQRQYATTPRALCCRLQGPSRHTCVASRCDDTKAPQPHACVLGSPALKQHHNIQHPTHPPPSWEQTPKPCA